MKYVCVNGGQPRGGFVLVNNDAGAEQIISEAVRTKGYHNTKWVLARHNANGTSTIRHSPYTIQIHGIRTTFPPPRELYPLCSHPMA